MGIQQRPVSARTVTADDLNAVALPVIGDMEDFGEVIRRLSYFIEEAIRTPSSFEGIQTSEHQKTLEQLVRYLAEDVHYRYILHALMVLKGEFDALETDDNRGVSQTRGYACEYVAWRFITHLSGREAVEYLLVELPAAADSKRSSVPRDEEHAIEQPRRREVSFHEDIADEHSHLIASSGADFYGSSRPGDILPSSNARETFLSGSADSDLLAAFDNCNALEVAAISEAKKFLSQMVVQKIIGAIWKGDVVFWETLDVDAIKEAKLYNKKKADPYCRLRVPRYLKFFEVIFFLSFLALYYAVLIPIQRGGSRDGKRPPGVPPPVNETSIAFTFSRPSTLLVTNGADHSFHHISSAEILLFLWIISFAYDEFGEYLDAGRAFYAADFWSLWDIGIIAIGVSFMALRVVGRVYESDDVIGAAFDVLALEALFLIPRICSLLSLNPYFGTLIPCLREMIKDFIKFLSFVAILYLGFLTTFTLLARDNFTLREMSWIIVKIFFGSSYLGFDVAQQISPVLGPPLMLIFITLTNILLITSLISLLSNSLTQILDHAREEYLFIYSVYVLEASTSNRLTYFLPPLNLIALILRPLRLVISAERLRRVRIVLMKITHTPVVAAIWTYENINDYLKGRSVHQGKSVSSLGGPSYGGSTKRTSYLKATRDMSRTLVAASPTHGSMSVADDRHGKSAAPHPAKAASDDSSSPNEDLKALVLALRDQVQELKDMVARQKDAE